MTANWFKSPARSGPMLRAWKTTRKPPASEAEAWEKADDKTDETKAEARERVEAEGK